MKYFLYYTCGSCNDGDHVSGLEEFDTLQEAEVRLLEIRQSHFDGTVTILHGESVVSRYW